MRLIGGLFVACLLILTGLLTLVRQQSPQPPYLIFSGRTGTQIQLFRMRPFPHATVQRITEGPYSNGNPIWSDEQQTLIFASRRERVTQFYTMNPNGRRITQLPEAPRVQPEVSYSPDGEWQVMAIREGGDLEDIFKSRRGGNEMIQLTDNPAWDVSPQWSPDGEWIVWVAYHQDVPNLYKMRPDGSAKTQLTFYTSVGAVDSPQWSPMVDLPWRAGWVLMGGMLAGMVIFGWRRFSPI